MLLWTLCGSFEIFFPSVKDKEETSRGLRALKSTLIKPKQTKREGEGLVQAATWTEGLLQGLEAWGSAGAQGQLRAAWFWGGGGGRGMKLEGWAEVSRSLASTQQRCVPCCWDPTGCNFCTEEGSREQQTSSELLFRSFQPTNGNHHPYWLSRGMERRNWKGQERLLSVPVPCYLGMTGVDIWSGWR